MSVEIVIGKIDCELLAIRNIWSDLYRKIRIVFFGPKLARHLIERLSNFWSVFLAYAKYNTFANLSAYWVFQNILQKCLAKDTIRFFGKEFLFKIFMEKGFLTFNTFFIFYHYGITFFRKQFCCDVCSCVWNNGIDQKSSTNAVKQTKFISWLAIFATKSRICVQQLPFFPSSRVFLW